MLVVCRLCIISCIPVVNVLSLGQTYTVADKKGGITDDIICGAIIPLVGTYSDKSASINHAADTTIFNMFPTVLFFRLVFSASSALPAGISVKIRSVG